MSAQRPTRRAVLVGLLGTVATACHPSRRPAASPPPDEAAIRAAVADEIALLASYDDVLQAHRSSHGVLRSERALHERHLEVLRGLLPATSPTPTASSPSSATGEQALRRLLSATATRLSAAAVRARVGDVAAVLASVAASHDVLGHTTAVTFTSSVSVGASGS